jgi:hypothetical protein
MAAGARTAAAMHPGGCPCNRSPNGPRRAAAGAGGDAPDESGADPRPQPPPRPEPDDCCNGGCTRCVFDVYDEARERYEAALRAWRARHAGRD